jgi:hypothetical protein
VKEGAMKKALFALALALALGLAPAAQSTTRVSVSIGGFYDELSPYGRWVTVGRWGTCWAPSVAATWQPYSNGEWLYTDYGWTWVSNDAWGGDPYHYGSWAWDPDYGWVWVPGDVWAPSWVTWCWTDDYVGWAPLPPSFTLTATGYYGSPIVEPARSFVFVPTRSFVSTNVSSVRVSPTMNATILPRAQTATRLTVTNGIVRNTALAPSQVARWTGRTIRPVSTSAAHVRPVALARTSRGSRISLAAPAETRRLLASRQLRGSARAPRPVSRAIAPSRPSRDGRVDRTAPRHEVRQSLPPARHEPPAAAHGRGPRVTTRNRVAPVTRHEAPVVTQHREMRHEPQPQSFHREPPPQRHVESIHREPPHEAPRAQPMHREAQAPPPRQAMLRPVAAPPERHQPPPQAHVPPRQGPPPNAHAAHPEKEKEPH